MSSETCELATASLHKDANIGHTLISLESSVKLPPDALEKVLEKACLCTLREIIFHLHRKDIDITGYDDETQLLFLTRLASMRFHSTCFIESNDMICIKWSLSPDLKVNISNWNVEQLKECASRFLHEASQISTDVKLHLACIAKDHQQVKDLVTNTTPVKRKNVLFYGISCGEIADVIVKSGVDVNTKDARGRTPLFYAMTSSMDSSKKLLEGNASVTKRDDCHVSVLTFFADNMLKCHLPAEVTGERIELLSEKGIARAQIIKEVINLILCKFIQVLGTMQPDSKTHDNYLKPSLLCELLKLVLRHTHDETHADDRNSLIRQLHSIQEPIAADNFVNVVSDVLKSFDTLGANPSAPDSEGNTCLHYATQLLFNGAPEKTVSDLCQKLMHMKHDARLDAKNHKKETPLLYFLSSTYEHLITSTEVRNWSGCLPKVCEVLMEQGKKLCHTNHKQESAFHLILKICQYAILLPNAEDLKLHIFEEMFGILSKFAKTKQKKAAVRKRDRHLNSPLHLLASLALKPSALYNENVCKGYTFENLLKKILDLLLKCGVLVDDGNKNKETPLHMCRTWTAAKLLLDAGAEPHVKDSSRCTPLLAAAKRNICIMKDSERFYPDVTQTPNEFWNEVLDKKFDPWTADKNGDSVLSILIQKEANCLAKALIETACRDKLQIDTIGVPLLIAVCKDQSSQNHWKLDLVKLFLNLRRSLVLSAVESNNDTALHFSCRNILDLPDSSCVQTSVHWKIVQYLLKCGADVNAVGERGESCLALSNNCPILKDLLSTPVDHSTLPLVLKNWQQFSKSHAQKLSLVARKIKYQHVKCQEKGSLHFYPEPLDKGKDSGSFVFPGIDQRGREVAVKRIDKSQIPPDKDPKSVLVVSARCEQIVEYIDHFDKGNFHYFAFELMEGDLDNHLDRATGAEDTVKLCKDLLTGLQFLQSQATPVVHGNLNPRTVFYQRPPKLCLKIGNCKVRSSRRGWIAPEVLKGASKTSKSDIFSCGLVLHYLLSGKKHPFAPDDTTTKSHEEVLCETDTNIRNGNIVKIDDLLSPEATHLVRLMLDRDPGNRPSAGDALVHPFFWNKKTKKEFLTKVGNEPEIENSRNPDPTLFRGTLEGQFSQIVSKRRWDDSSTYGKISATCAGIPSRGRHNYNFSSVADLIRFIRNVYGHINDYHPNIQVWWNKDCVFDCFPRLIIEVYKVVKGHNLHNSRPQIQKFFNELRVPSR